MMDLLFIDYTKRGLVIQTNIASGDRDVAFCVVSVSHRTQWCGTWRLTCRAYGVM